MKHGLYGRMGLGRCVEQDLGFLGCYVDVLPILDDECSGKQECSFTVMDTTFTNANPCSNDLKLYLETDYFCQTGKRRDSLKFNEVQLLCIPQFYRRHLYATIKTNCVSQTV